MMTSIVETCVVVDGGTEDLPPQFSIMFLSLILSPVLQTENVKGHA